MNKATSVSEAGPERSQPRTPKQRSWLWRVGRFCMLGFITLITLYVLFLVEESWRGKRAWKHYKAVMEAEGAVFELRKLVSSPIPDEQNFAMTPLLEPILDLYPPGTTNTSRWRNEEGKRRLEAIQLEDMELSNRMAQQPMTGAEAPGLDVPEIPGRQNWHLGERISLEDWQDYYRESASFPSWPEQRSAAEDVLKALSRYDSELDELQKASQRPYARFNVFYGEENPVAVLLPHLKVLRDLAKVVQLRAVAELEADQAEAAYKDVQLLFALADSIKDEPTLISYLVRLALISITEQTIWEGLLAHQWTDAQLQALQHLFAGMDLVAEMKRAMESERAWGTEIFEWLMRKPEALFELSGSTGSDLGKTFVNLIPTGWIYFEAVNYNQLFDRAILEILPEQADDLYVGEIKKSTDNFDSELAAESNIEAFFSHRILLKMLMPALGGVPPKAARAEAMKNMTLTAIALERYYRSNQTCPESLEKLVPKFVSELPHDPITHQPLRYKRVNAGSFRLWSVGWNQVDDEGVVVVRSNERGPIVEEEGDWVWPQPEGMKFQVVED